MSTDYGNYSRELGKAREDFNSTTQKLKESYDTNLKTVEETANKKLEDNKKVNETRKEKIVEENVEQLNNFSTKTNKILEKRQKEFLDNLKAERDSFDVEQKKTKENFHNNLNTVKESYSRTAEQMKDSNERQTKENEEKYFNAIQATRFNTDKKISEIEKSSAKMFTDISEDSINQKKELSHKQQKNLEEINKEHNKELDKKTENTVKKIAEISRTKDNELKNLVEKYDFNIEKSKSNEKELYDSTLERYQDHTQDLLGSFQGKYSKLEDETKHKLDTQKSQFDKQLYNVEREKDIYVDKNFKGEGADAQKKILKDNYEHRLSNLKKQIGEQSSNFQREASELSNDMKLEVKARDLENRKTSDRREDQFHKDITEIERRSKTSEDRISTTFRNKLNEQIDTDQKKINFETDLGKSKLENQKIDFGKTVNKLTEMNISNVDKLQNQSSKEKSEILEKAKIDLHNNTQEIKDTYRQKFDKAVNSYEQKFENQQNLVEKIKDESNGKVEEISRNSQHQIEIESAYNKEARESDRRLMSDNIADMKHDFEVKSKMAKQKFDQELGQVKNQNDVLLTRVIKKSDNEKALLIAENNRDLKRITSQLKDEYARFAKNSKMEKDNLIETYERRIGDLKNSYELEKLKFSENKKDKANQTQDL